MITFEARRKVHSNRKQAEFSQPIQLENITVSWSRTGNGEESREEYGLTLRELDKGSNWKEERQSVLHMSSDAALDLYKQLGDMLARHPPGEIKTPKDIFDAFIKKEIANGAAPAIATGATVAELLAVEKEGQ